jgi:uncharacterized membrane protein
MHTEKSLLIRLFNTISSLFVTGLIAILPVTLTVVIVTVMVRFIIRLFAPIHCLLQPTIFGHIPYGEIIIIVVSIFLLGIIYKFVIVRSLFRVIDAIFSNVPFIRTLYSGIRQLVHALSAQDGFTFKQVVLVEFPRKGVYSLGFVMSKLPDNLLPKPNVPLYSVYIPTTPNPTTGYFIVSPAQEFTIVDLTRQEAMALIVSGGILQPERFKNST